MLKMSTNSTCSDFVSAVLLRIDLSRQSPNQRAVCSVIAGANHNIIHLNSPEFVIGRQGNCQYAFDTTDVSRQHAKFIYEQNSWKIVDLSSNGTWISNQSLLKFVPTPLKDKQVITLSRDPQLCYIFLANTTPDKLNLPKDEDVEVFDSCLYLNPKLLTCASSRKRPNSLDSEEDGSRFKRFQTNSPTLGSFVGSAENNGIDAGHGESNSTLKARNPESTALKVSPHLVDSTGNVRTKHAILEEYVCPLCLELVVKPTSLVPCGHVFCFKCICKWREEKRKQTDHPFCPVCRQMPAFCFPNRGVEKTIESFVQFFFDDQEKAKRKQLVEEYAKEEELIPVFFKSLQYDPMIHYQPPIYMNESNELIPLPGFEFDIMFSSDNEDSDDSEDSEDNHSDVPVEMIEDLFNETEFASDFGSDSEYSFEIAVEELDQDEDHHDHNNSDVIFLYSNGLERGPQEAPDNVQSIQNYPAVRN